MSQAASHAAAFYEQVPGGRVVWTLKDEHGYPALNRPDGWRAMPFWSSRSRVERVIKAAPGFADFEPASFTWGEFCQEWVPRLEAAGTLVGVNWSGPRATGVDLGPRTVEEVVTKVIERERLPGLDDLS